MMGADWIFLCEGGFMERFVVEGDRRLQGSISPAGNKNEALPALAAALLTDKPITLHNVPRIDDIRDMVTLIEGLGVTVERPAANTLRLHAKGDLRTRPDDEIARRIRGSILLAAPLLIRMGSVVLATPGGDRIGWRRLDVHLNALEKFNARWQQISHRMLQFSLHNNRFQGSSIFLDEASVTGTESAILAAVLAKGESVIENAACEPHVQGLCRMLQTMGAQIAGVGSNRLCIQGVDALGGCEHRLGPDHIEVGSFIALAAATRSELLIEHAGLKQLHMMRLAFRRLGVKTEGEANDSLRIPAGQDMVIANDYGGVTPRLDSAPWPALPSDLSSIFLVTATQCHGQVMIFEKMFENRLFWVDRLIAMGARVVLCDPHRALINGPVVLHGAHINTPDIRAGMALLIASLAAQGQSTIQNIAQIDRGYQNIDTRLNQLGASIQRVTR